MANLTFKQWAVYALHGWSGIYCGFPFSYLPYGLRLLVRFLPGGDIAFAIIEYVDPEDVIIQSVMEATEL